MSPASSRTIGLISRISQISLISLFMLCAYAHAADTGPHIGPLFDHFGLTLAPGERTEAAGPFFYSETQETQHTWAIPPLFSITRDPATESEEIDFVYPLLTYDRFGEQYRWQLFQLLSFSGGPTQLESKRDRFTLFPFYFQQRSTDPSQNYTAVFPFYGHIQNRLFRSEVWFVSPFYVKSRRRDVITENYFYSFFHIRHGDSLEGWQFWPLYGTEHKDVTTRTNTAGDVEHIGGHRKEFVLWPFYFNEWLGLGTENPESDWGVLPLFSITRSPKRDVTTVLFPFFTHIDDLEQNFREWQAPWPLIEFTRGEGKTMNRVVPFFSVGHTATLESRSYIWPIYKYNRVHADPLDRRRTRILFYLFDHVDEKNTETGDSRIRTDLWPLFIYHGGFDGTKRLQLFAPL